MGAKSRSLSGEEDKKKHAFLRGLFLSEEVLFLEKLEESGRWSVVSRKGFDVFSY